MGDFQPPKIDGAALRSRREKADLSLRELAEKAHTSKVNLIHLEHGKAGASPEMILRLAQALNCQPHELCKDHTPWPKDWKDAASYDLIRAHAAQAHALAEKILNDPGLKDAKKKNPTVAKRVEAEARNMLERTRQMLKDLGSI